MSAPQPPHWALESAAAPPRRSLGLSPTAAPGRGVGHDGLHDLVLPAEMVVGEAVLLDLRPASFATRALAYLLDLLIQAMILGVVVIAAAVIGSSLDDAAMSALVLGASVIALVGVPVTWETWTRGRSPGKAAMGLRVVRDDGGPIRFRQALIRGLVALPEITLASGAIALICSLANSRGKRVGDLLAGTYVVRDRIDHGFEGPPMMPPRLRDWARQVDIARIPDPLAVAARQVLNRAHTLNPQSQQRLTADLAQQLSAYVAPTPAGPVAPAEFVAAVLAERHRRDVLRLMSLRERRDERARRRAETGVLSPASSRLL